MKDKHSNLNELKLDKLFMRSEISSPKKGFSSSIEEEEIDKDKD
jgi:hypothetical protein